MGSFSWLKADNLTKIANVQYGAPFKFLIPEEFGGGYIKDYYQDYGYLGTKEDGTPKYDMYELLAFWNHEIVEEYGYELQYDEEEMPMMKEIDQHTFYNRNVGINIGCYDKQIDRLKYPLKLVSCSYKGSYEDCEGRSYNDPAQGSYPLTRKNLEEGHF